ncbi:hypothetical protein BD310DRAFT_33154 [Dichomitus squalens]|uniref:Uncharacterized protein n=1 Tax=Dichomitus squalens TaxID=114155 RepID=A0A4Q9QEY1_9APHY|nr:hypothetical protein BD310DRAFT_33154 [Dichomitus squalens]
MQLVHNDRLCNIWTSCGQLMGGSGSSRTRSANCSLLRRNGYGRGLARCSFPSARLTIESNPRLTPARDYLSHRRGGVRITFRVPHLPKKPGADAFNVLALACYGQNLWRNPFPSPTCPSTLAATDTDRAPLSCVLSNLALLRPRPHVSQLDSDLILICPSRRNMAQSSREAVRYADVIVLWRIVFGSFFLCPPANHPGSFV